MKKLLMGVCIIVILAFTGCVSTSMAFVFDPEIPEEQMSSLWVPNYITVVQFDGKTVNWKGGGLSGTVRVGVPSGEFTFIIESDGVASAGLAPVRNKSFTKNFETGKGYQLINRSGEIILLDL